MKNRTIPGYFGLVLFLLISGCTGVVGKFPEPLVGFQPQRQYGVTYDKMWISVIRVLEMERINVATSDKEGGRIVTDYLTGVAEKRLAGFGSTIMSRYKFTLYVEKIEQNRTRLNVVCTLEAAGAGERAVPWHDVSRDNANIVNALENWLYERIEKSL